MQISPHVHLVGSEQMGLSHPLDCSCYLLDGGSASALVDAGLGLGGDEILANIQAARLAGAPLTHILITHAHLGHWGGARWLRERTGAQIWAHENATAPMSDIENDPGIQANIRHGRYPAGFRPQPCPPDRTFRDGEAIRIGNLTVRPVLVQGHTKDSICYFFEDEGRRGLLTGDVVFYAGKIGLLNLEGCSMSDYRRDIHRLADLDIDMLLPGHGVFVLRRGQKHIRRAIQKLGDFVLPDTFFEDNEFMWDRDYLRTMAG